jgi:hypothetical protein
VALPLSYSPKHHKKASKATIKVNEVNGFNEFKISTGNKTRTSENSQLIISSSEIKIIKGTVPPEPNECGRCQGVTSSTIYILEIR